MSVLFRTHVWFAAILFSCSAADFCRAGDQLELVEQVRGGRHWADEKTAPPRSPAETLNSFAVEPGVRVELFAAEPLVKDPVAIAFDEQGSMYVAEYGDYPVGPEDGQNYLSRIVRLRDTDADGRADERIVFADQLKFAHSMMPYRGGLIVCAQTEILFLVDQDGDGRSDERKTLFSGFTPAHPQMQIGNPRWGMDNWIYFNYGPGKITRTTDGKEISMPRSEFRLNPVTGEFGPASGLGQYGNTIDRWGHRFFCTNRNPVIGTVMDLETSRRNPYQRTFSTQYDVAASGGEARVFPLIAMKSNYLSHAGTHTAACGTTACLSDRFPESVRDSVFVCEPIGHLVTRSVVSQSGVELSAERARPKADFLASTDPWFRPSSLANGPDGALYLADMYRLWVEHPKFLPDDIAAKLDWRAGDDRGRIWRIVPDSDESQPVPFTPPSTEEDLPRLLESDSGWQRFLGQRLIVERQLRSLNPELHQLLKQAPRPETRLHAIWTLAGIQAVTSDDIKLALQDDHPAVRMAGLQLATASPYAEQLLPHILKLASDPEVVVRFETLLALADFSGPAVDKTLAELAMNNGDDARIRQALLTGVTERSANVLAQLLDNAEFIGQSAEWKRDLMEELALVSGHRGDRDEVQSLLNSLHSKQQPGQWWQFAIVSGLSDGLARGRHADYSSLATLMNNPPDDWQESTAALQEIMNEATTLATDRKAALGQRLAAIDLLSRERSDQARETLLALISPSEPPPIRAAALELLGNYADAGMARQITERWDSFSPALQNLATQLLFRRSEQILVVLEEMQAGNVPASVVDLDQRVRLLKHRDETISSLARKVFGEAVSANRRQVIEDYQEAIRLTGDLEAGRLLFEKHCQKCHRRNGKGETLGPDISDLANRPVDAILFDILDPNRKVEPRFTEYVVVDASGLLHHGMIINETETSLILAQPGGRTVEIQRADVDELQNTGRSLMPEGLEKEISVKAMADLLTFLRN